jgi:dihydroxyacid dehydratase/phosphogluconate dehydratase
MLLAEPSGNLFGMTQDAGMGWNPADVNRPQVLIVSTQGGLRDADGRPVALGFHTGHWEIGLLVRAAAETLRDEGVVPFAAYCSDPCDGRTQGTVGMFDSLPYRNDAAITMRRLIRSLPRRAGVMGIATCDKGLPATMIALAGCSHLPGIVVPGGFTIPFYYYDEFIKRNKLDDVIFGLLNDQKFVHDPAYRREQLVLLR